MPLRRLSVLICLLILLAPLSRAQNSFPFVIPWDDAEPGTATDVSHLNTVPAGAHGHVVARDGHFVESDTGERVRLLGTNFSANWNFPTKPDAEKVAARLAKYGVNIVRLHHMDNSWDLAHGSGIWKADDPRHLELDPDQLDRLDYLVAQLKANGIYVNLNLKVSKKLSEADGFPASVNGFGWSYQKRVDIFNRRMIELQKEYARRLLTHKNPYTGLTYAEDPCVAVVEINNENALVSFSSSALGDGLTGMPEPFRGELAALWNQWLAERYDDDEALRQAWAAPAAETVANPLPADAAWKLVLAGPTEATMHAEAEDRSVSQPVKVDVTKVSSTSWHVQLHVPGVQLIDDQYYTLRFRAKSSRPRKVRVAAMQDRDAFRNNGLGQSAALGTQWQDFSYAFKARGIDPGHTRVSFNLGDDASTVWFDGFSMEPGSTDVGPDAGESLAQGNLPLPTSMTDGLRRDWIQFLTELERDYAQEMLAFLRNDLSVKASVIDTQFMWGGLTAYTREAAMDFMDTHRYWQHPKFTNGWSETNWTQASRSLVDAWAAGERGTLDALAQLRWDGRPMSVSEYDHPAPNPFAIEMMPVLAGFASAQDWDALYSFDYGPYGQARQNDYISRFFDQGNHPGKMAFYPSAAMIFRGGLLEPAASSHVLQLPERPYEQHERVSSMWAEVQVPRDIHTMLSHRLSVEPQPSPAVERAAVLSTEAPAAEGQAMRVEQGSDGGTFLAYSPFAAMIAGHVGGQAFELGNVGLTFDSFPTGFAALTVVAMDGRPLATSQRILVTVMGQVQNQGMVWNEQRNSVGGNWGHGPTLIDAVPVKVTIEGSADRVVYPLSENGQRQAKTVGTDDHQGGTAFSTDPAHATVWYELVPR